jgi:hypothetical protein
MASSLRANEVVLGNKNSEVSQTIFLATRMDLMAHIMPKREKPKQGFTFPPESPNYDLQQKPTIH